jgi:transcriptional regulator with GAF, ATPase, and Fis domain
MNEITITVSVGQPYTDQMRACKRSLVLHALGETNGNVKAAARRLGMDRGNLYRVMKELAIVVRRRADGTTDQVDEVFGDLEQRLRAREA